MRECFRAFPQFRVKSGFPLFGQSTTRGVGLRFWSREPAGFTLRSVGVATPLSRHVALELNYESNKTIK